MSVFQMLAGKMISRSDVLAAWDTYLILIPVLALISLLRLVSYRIGFIVTVSFTLLFSLYSLAANDASPCPEYFDVGLIIVAIMLSFIYAVVFWGQTTRRRISSLVFLLIGLAALFLSQSGTLERTYHVLFKNEPFYHRAP